MLRASGVLMFLLVLAAHAGASESVSLTVMDPFVEMRTGPGRAYPVFHVIEAGEQLKVEKRRTDWFKVTTIGRRAKHGWVSLAQMQRTVDDDGAFAVFDGSDPQDLTSRRFEWSVSAGDFEGASAISTAVAWRLTPNIAVQLEGTQILGEFSDGQMVCASIRHIPFPDSRFSPYFQLGTGILRTSPFSTIVQSEDRQDRTVNVGAGINVYLARRFFFFFDYRHHNVLTSRENNEEINEWKLGINVLF